MELFLVGGFCFGGDQLVAFAVDVDNLDWGIIFEKFTQFGDVNIHASCIEVVIVDPDCLEGIVALKNVVDVWAEKVLFVFFLWT